MAAVDRRMPPVRTTESTADTYAAALHDTTNTLTIILGWLDRAEQACEEHGEVLEALRRAADQARTARDTLRRTIGAQLPPTLAQPATTLAKRAIEDLAIEAARARVTAQALITAPWGERSISHPNSVAQILTNLLLNAISAAPVESEILLRVDGDGDPPFVRFSVVDQGPGIPDSRRASIFDGGASERRGGVGIGLRHARVLAEQHSGSLELVPTAAGARFDLRWPHSDAPYSDAGVPSPTKTASRRDGPLSELRVLLLEDDDEVVELLELTLRARGARVTAIRNPDELTARLEEDEFDTLLVDLSPLAAPLEQTVRDARAITPDLDVIVISGRATLPPAQPGVLCLRKPFEPAELVAVIERARARRSTDGATEA